MFKACALFVSLCCWLVSNSAADAGMMFRANLDGAQEVPPNNSAATGFATLLLNDAQDRLEIMLSVIGVDFDGNQTPNDPSDNLAALHIHNAPAGMNGPIVFGFIFSSDTNGDLVIDPDNSTVFSGWDLDEGNNTTLGDQLANLFAGNLYINLHTVEFPAGEIRGQIQAVPEASTWATWCLLIGLCAGGHGLMRRRRKS